MRHNLQFSILDDLVNNPELLVISDDSSYIETPILPIIQIRFPGFTEWSEHLIVPNQLNRFTTVQLKHSKSLIAFPDGVYEIRYSISPHTKLNVTKGYVRSVQFKKSFISYLEKIGVNDAVAIDKVWQIELYLQAAKANAENGDLNSAKLNFQQAEKELKRLTCE